MEASTRVRSSEQSIRVLVAKSSLDGHLRGVGKVVPIDNGMNDILVVSGGPILKDDEKELLELGIAGVFPPGSLAEGITAFIRERCRPTSG